MPLTASRGLTLLELLLGLSLCGMIGTLLVRSSLQLTRAVAQLQQRGTALSALDQGSAWLAAELGDVAPGDLRRMTAESFSYRGLRVAGLGCEVTATDVRFLPQARAGGRDPQPGRDTLLLYTGAPHDSGWVALPIMSVAAATCDGSAALRVGTVVDSLTLARVRLLPLVPVRIFESMQSRFYLSGDAWWLGARSESAGEGLQPLAGPYPAGGVQLRYLDAAAQPTADPGAVRHFLVRLETTMPSGDSTTLHLVPRNLRQ